MQHAATAARRSATLEKDPLTGLYQQDYLLRQLTRLVRQQRREPVVASLALLQLENFYEIRGWLGRAEANQLLSDIARLLLQSLPPSVLLCRCQHYEFALLLRDEYSVRASAITAGVKQALHSAASDSIPPQLELKCAVGLATIGRATPAAEVLFAQARHNLTQALYRPRHDGALDSDADVHTVSVSQLLAILRRGEISLCWQAVAPLRGVAPPLYEIRIATTASPALNNRALFATAVQNALGERIDRWVVMNSLYTLQQTHSDDLRLLVNLTQNTLVSTTFFPWLEQQLRSRGTLAQRLIFQISELDLLSAQHHLAYFCGFLTRLGIELSISHFGCTADPFRYLPLLKAQYARLDAALLDRVHLASSRLQRLGTMTDRLHDSGLQVVAAMVEELALLPALWEARVDYVQGLSVAPPDTAMTFHFPVDRVLDLTAPGSR